jgi:hypothetical protein
MPFQSGSYCRFRADRTGMHNSVCTRCYLLVAASNDERDLGFQEQSHNCDRANAYQVSKFADQVIAVLDGFAGRT